MLRYIKFHIAVLLLFSSNLKAQLQYNNSLTLGDIAEAYEIKGNTVVKNTGNNKLYLLRADAEYGIKVQTSKKALLPGDTALLSIWFNPEKSGRFSKNISLVHSQSAEPAIIKVSGNLLKYKADDKTACFYFGEKHNQAATTLTILPSITSATQSQVSTATIALPTATQVTNTLTVSQASVPAKQYSGTLPESAYKPNNLIFLVDVSSSMRDSLKLPLMKLALYELVNELREVDRVTFITYADTVKVLAEGVNSANKELLLKQIAALKAKGMTKGRKAILFSQQLAQQHYIDGGNNQIIIASDGQFKFEKDDQKLWKDRQSARPILISTIAFGSDKNAIKTLKSIAHIGKGSFIQIRSKEESGQKLLDEIKQRSKLDNR